MRVLLHEGRERVCVSIAAVCCLAGLALGAEPLSGEKARVQAGLPKGGILILDESAYCRAYYHFGVQKVAPRTLKADAGHVSCSSGP